MGHRERDVESSWIPKLTVFYLYIESFLGCCQDLLVTRFQKLGQQGSAEKFYFQRSLDEWVYLWCAWWCRWSVNMIKILLGHSTSTSSNLSTFSMIPTDFYLGLVYKGYKVSPKWIKWGSKVQK